MPLDRSLLLRTYSLDPSQRPEFVKLLTRLGVKREDFSVTFNLYDIPVIENFVAREEELAEIYRRPRGDGSRRAVVLHGLGGIGKT
jgi:hypothetical protein